MTFFDLSPEEEGPEEEILARIAEDALFRHTGKRLTKLEDTVLRATLRYRQKPLTYAKLAKTLGYSPQRITEVGAKLWAKLADALSTPRLCRKDVYSTLKRVWQLQHKLTQANEPKNDRCDSMTRLHMRHSSIERIACGALMQPGGCLRMIGPEKDMILDHVILTLQEQDLQIAKVDFALMADESFASLRLFLRRFCIAVGMQLDLTNAMAEYWDEDCDLLQNTTTYFEKHLLSDRPNPVVLLLDNVDHVFEHQVIRDDFCKLIVGWHRLGVSGRSKRRSEIWASLRILIVHSKEIYENWDINYSPLLGVGTVANLSDFYSLEK